MEDKAKLLHIVAVTAVIYKKDEGKFLITKRSPNEPRFPNRWTVPGGKLSRDDYENAPMSTENQWYHSLTNTLKREVKEETNLEIGKPEYLLDLTFIKMDQPVLVISFMAQYESGEVVIDAESSDFAWITAEEVGNYDLIEGIDEEIKEVSQILKQRAEKGSK
jgi:8-oxo-dGTP pyrophosphatase MutT (NUDIX family)